MTIEDWQEYIAALPEKQFFSIMRLYLGEIKTPYNKHKLISQLAGFIHNEENSQTIISLLDDFEQHAFEPLSLFLQKHLSNDNILFLQELIYL